MSVPAGSPQFVTDTAGTSDVTFHAHDASDRRFFIRGRIDPYTDHLTFRIATRVLSTGERSRVPPDDLFDAMMAHFDRQPGGLPDVIRAIWDDADPEFATNLSRFNAALAAGADEATAVGATFTGRMAKRYNYLTVVMGITDPLSGPPYRRVSVYFKR